MGPKRRSLCLAAALLLGLGVSTADSLNDVESLLQQHLVQALEDPTPDSNIDPPMEVATQPKSAPVESAPSPPEMENETHTSIPKQEEEEPEDLEPFDEIGPIGEETNTTETIQAVPHSAPKAAKWASIFEDFFFNPVSLPAKKGKASKFREVDGDYVIDMTWDEYIADQARALADEKTKEFAHKERENRKKFKKMAGHAIKHGIWDANKVRKAASKQLRKDFMKELENQKIQAIKKVLRVAAPARKDDISRNEKIRRLVDNTIKPLTRDHDPNHERQAQEALTAPEKKLIDHRAKVEEWHRIESEQRQEKRRLDAIRHAKIEHDKAIKEKLHGNHWPSPRPPRSKNEDEEDRSKKVEEEEEDEEEEEEVEDEGDDEDHIEEEPAKEAGKEEETAADAAAKEKAPNPPTEQPPPQ